MFEYCFLYIHEYAGMSKTYTILMFCTNMSVYKCAEKLKGT